MLCTVLVAALFPRVVAEGMLFHGFGVLLPNLWMLVEQLSNLGDARSFCRVASTSQIKKDPLAVLAASGSVVSVLPF